MIITRTPLRISFFGGGTDYPIWHREFGGAVLSTAIDKACYITCRRLPPFFEYHSRISYSKVENVNQNSAIAHPSVRACLQYLACYWDSMRSETRCATNTRSRSMPST